MPTPSRGTWPLPPSSPPRSSTERWMSAGERWRLIRTGGRPCRAAFTAASRAIWKIAVSRSSSASQPPRGRLNDVGTPYSSCTVSASEPSACTSPCCCITTGCRRATVRRRSSAASAASRSSLPSTSSAWWTSPFDTASRTTSHMSLTAVSVCWGPSCRQCASVSRSASIASSMWSNSSPCSRGLPRRPPRERGRSQASAPDARTAAAVAAAVRAAAAPASEAAAAATAPHAATPAMRSRRRSVDELIPQRQRDGLGARVGLELRHGVPDVRSYRLGADEEPLGDVGIREPVRQESEDLALAPRECRQALRCLRGHKLRRERRVDVGASLGHALHRPHDVVGRRLLEDVAARPAVEALRQEPALAVGRVQDHRHLGMRGRDLAGGLEPVHALHAHVHHDHVGTALLGHLDGAVAGRALADDRDLAVAGEDHLDALPHGSVIVHHQATNLGADFAVPPAGL